MRLWLKRPLRTEAAGCGYRLLCKAGHGVVLCHKVKANQRSLVPAHFPNLPAVDV